VNCIGFDAAFVVETSPDWGHPPTNTNGIEYAELTVYASVFI